jgi:hypothetical protein
MRRFFVKPLSLFAIAVAVIASGQVSAQDIPLAGWFSGRGDSFSGYAYPIGRFRGVSDAETATAEWRARRGSLINQTTRFDLVFPIFRNLYYYEQSVTITDGSGRYGDLTGEAEIIGLINVRSGRYFGFIDGELTREEVPSEPPADPPPGSPPPEGPPS